MNDEFDPYRKWLAIKSPERPPNHYRLLGLELFESDPEVVESAADRQMAHVRTFQTGPHSALSQQILNQLAAARVCLLNREQKAAYDRQLQAELSATPASAPPLVAPPPVASPPVAVAAPIPVAAQPPTPVSVAFAFDGKTMDPPRIIAERPPLGRNASVIAAGMTLALLAAVGAYVLFASATRGSSRATAELPIDAATTKTPKETAPPISTSPPAALPKVIETSTPAPESKQLPVMPPSASTPDAMPAPPPLQPPASAPKNIPETPPPPKPQPAETEREKEKRSSLPHQKRAVPDDRLQREAEQRLDSVLAPSKGAADAAKKSALAKELLQRSEELRDDSPGLYVVLIQVRELAIDGENAELAFSAIERLAEAFEIDPLLMKLETIERLAQSLNDAAAQQTLGDAALALADEALADGRVEEAGRLASVMPALADKSRDTAWRKEIRARAGELKQTASRWSELPQTLKALKQNPDDASANALHGKYLCLVLEAWDRGLPALAKGDDKKWAAAARQDLALPADAAGQAAVGDAWWDLSLKESSRDRPALQQRAVHWYQVAMPGLSGAAVVQTQKRINVVSQSAQKPSGRSPGRRVRGKGAMRLGKEAFAANRRAAEWILAMGGILSYVTADGAEKGANTLADLPAESFLVTDIELQARPGVDDQGLGNLAGLAAVKRLQLTSTAVTDAALSNLAEMTNLEFLGLSNTRVRGEGLGKLRPMPNLKHLGLMHIGVDDAAAEFIGGCSQLEVLLMQDAAITDRGLEKFRGLAKLQMLNLTGAKITDAGLKSLSGMVSLKQLELSNLPLTGEGFQHVSGLNSLEVLHLVNDPVSDEGLKAIGQLTSLQVLLLHSGSSQVTDAGVAYLARLTRLRELRLDGAKVTGGTMHELKRLKGLEVLSANGSPFSDAGAEALTALVNLRDVGIVRSAITDAALASFEKLPNLKVLSVQESGLSAEAVANFRRAKPNCVVHGP